MEIHSATLQKNALVMADTIREGFAARPSIEGSPNTNLSKKRARTSSQVARDDPSGHFTKNVGTWRGRLVLPKWWWLRQATPTGKERMMMSVS